MDSHLKGERPQLGFWFGLKRNQETNTEGSGDLYTPLTLTFRISAPYVSFYQEWVRDP